MASLGAVAAGFTALCCIGVSAAVSLSTALGATFLTRDSTLRPLLAVTLAVTVAGSALTYTYWRRRRRPLHPALRATVRARGRSCGVGLTTGQARLHSARLCQRRYADGT